MISAQPKHLWIVESGKYEQRSAILVAATPESAVGYFRREHPEGDWEYIREDHPAIFKNGEIYVSGWTNHKIIGSVYINPPHNMDLSPCEYNLEVVEFVE